MGDDLSSRQNDPADFGLLFALAFASYVDELHAELRKRGFVGVRSAFGPVLRGLRTGEQTLTVLARELGVSKQAVGRVVEEMRSRGLVEQRPDPADGRARILSLSTRGQEMASAAIAIGEVFERALASELGSARADELRKALEHIVERAGAGGELAARRVRIV
jgi:DNA-binding MarR family transcriptional regulator